MFSVTVKYVCAHPYDFTTDNGQHIVGCNLICYDAETKDIIKVKQTKTLNKLNFGDDLTVRAIVRGDRVRFEV